jgi:hypothetical protein
MTLSNNKFSVRDSADLILHVNQVARVAPDLIFSGGVPLSSVSLLPKGRQNISIYAPNSHNNKF